MQDITVQLISYHGRLPARLIVLSLYLGSGG